ncbi:hypothetical protein TRFO_30472 [Tritrichomonas foetus]|uniref:Uncharacterized protein n=1 Tax=Tritrichomonas foetus TaxID=1144522 RepID=A0A1J4JYR8_9EUKA|nr:hypothetical protein TRFO_30472 [Tritrichomonas foetus]|eukprot:OHT02413.1 hypothetical protein TRFO_30472 [Tritrichomonas foetus]
MNLHYKKIDSPLKNQNENAPTNIETPLYLYIKESIDFQNLFSIHDLIIKIIVLIKEYIKNSNEEDLNSLNDTQYKQLAYHFLCLLIKEDSSFVPKLIGDYQGFDIPKQYDNSNTKSLFEASPEMLAILYFVKYYKPIDENNDEERDMLGSIYTHFVKRYVQRFHSTFCFLKVICVKILTYTMIWMKDYYPCFATAPSFINENRIIVSEAINNLISNNYCFYAHQTGVKCFLKILQNKIYSTEFTKLIPLLINSSHYQSTLKNIYQCIGYLIPQTNNEYKTILSNFLKQQYFNQLSYSDKISYIDMMSILIENEKSWYYHDWHELTTNVLQFMLHDSCNYEVIVHCFYFLSKFFQYKDKQCTITNKCIVEISKKCPIELFWKTFADLKGIFYVACKLKENHSNEQNDDDLKKTVLLIANEAKIPIEDLIESSELFTIEECISIRKLQSFLDVSLTIFNIVDKLNHQIDSNQNVNNMNSPRYQ